MRTSQANPTDAVAATNERKMADALKQAASNGADVNVFLAARKADTKNPFVILFIDAMYELIDGKFTIGAGTDKETVTELTRSEIKVIFGILKYMQYGNLIALNQAKLAEKLKMDKSNFSKIMKRLRHLEIILEEDSGLYFNPQLIYKGNLRKGERNMSELLSKGREGLRNILDDKFALNFGSATESKDDPSTH